MRRVHLFVGGADMTTTLFNKEELRATVADVLDMPVEDVTDDANFIDDLAVDSLMALEVVVVLEKKYRVKFVEAELRQVVSLQHAYDLVTAKLEAA
jgi:acyl carrier protein